MPPIRSLRLRSNRLVSIICFRSGNGLVHLVVTDRAGLLEPPPSDAPQFAGQGRWTTASWSRGDKAYMLATDGSAEDLKPLLSSDQTGGTSHEPIQI